MIAIDTDFPWLGSRRYVHGTSILSGFLNALEPAAGGAIRVKRLKLQRPATTNGRMVLSQDPLSATEAADANCTFQAQAGGTLWHGAFLERGLPVRAQVDAQYGIADVVADRFGGSCTISAHGRDDFIRTLVEANKRFHERSADTPPHAVRFGYIEDWQAPAIGATVDTLLTARNLITRKTGDGCMTINRLEYRDETGGAVTLTLCFNVTLAESAAA